MRDLIIFENENFGSIRSLKIDNEPWFVAKDVCDILDIKNSTQAVRRLDNDEVTMLNIGSKSGNTYFVNEYGLYNLILASRKPEAREFKRWITHEVIPSIRKTGNYNLDMNALINQLTQSQINTNNILVGFKNQIDTTFKETNQKLLEHDELLRKRVYVSPKEANDIKTAMGCRARQIALENNLNYHNKTIKCSLYQRLYKKFNQDNEISTYRELPSMYYTKAIKQINVLDIYVEDLAYDDNQINLYK